ncbi:hypothetical protein [Christensenella minuta]|uniref:hypothetical protein n=1 Tax=Christensenella minuta TaxID=626937 RepID=UPI002157EE2C|nr:hypothetical protein [Christensenella minuta]
MIKTNPYSRFSLLTLEQIRDSREVILQVEKTNSTFVGDGKSCYLCEVVGSLNYNKRTLEDAMAEIIRLNRILDRRDKRIKTLENKLKQEQPDDQ